jgi:ubiquinone/menaquinone biosynthesis C-methylase UbiE
MGTLKNFVNPLHQQTKRNYIERMINEKVECSKVAQQYDEKYWDGERKYGYGGYKFIPGRWKPVAQDLIKTYNLKAGSKVLDVGCGKGFLIYEMLQIEPKLDIIGFDISNYAIKNSKEEIKDLISIGNAEKKFLYPDKSFDLVISLGSLHNLSLEELSFSLKEITRVSKQSYIMVESYRTQEELFNFQCWALTCKTFLSFKDWIWFFKENNFEGDYEFIYFE